MGSSCSSGSPTNSQNEGYYKKAEKSDNVEKSGSSVEDDKKGSSTTTSGGGSKKRAKADADQAVSKGSMDQPPPEPMTPPPAEAVIAQRTSTSTSLPETVATNEEVVQNGGIEKGTTSPSNTSVIRPSVTSPPPFNQLTAITPCIHDFTWFPNDIKSLLLGKSIPESEVLTPNVINLYVSANAADSSIERSYLYERVYPKLSLYCAERGYQLHVIDLHWGIQSEVNHLTYLQRLCLAQLSQAQKLPCIFTLFLNELYGVVLPPCISKDDFNQIISSVKSDEQSEMLKKWYKIDHNITPSTYCLADSPLDRNTSINIMDALFKNMTSAQRESYLCSVMEHEIRHGILHDNFDPDSVLWVNRTFSNVGENNPTLFNDYIDNFANHSELGQFIQERLMQLRNKVHHRLLMNRNSALKYEVKWSHEGFNPEKVAEHSEYIDRLCGQFEDSIVRIIDKLIRDCQEKDDEKPYKRISDKLYEDLSNNYIYCNNLGQQSLLQRTEPLQRIQDYVTDSKSSHVLIIHGKPGSGIGTVLAHATRHCRMWLQDSICVYRFVKVSDGQSLGDALRSICEQIAILYDLPVGWQMKESLADVIHRLPPSKTLVIFIDDISAEKAYDDVHGLDWIPGSLPSTVKLILSVRNDSKCFSDLKNRFSDGSHLYEMPGLAASESETLFNNLLKSQSRTLAKHQKEAVNSVIKTCTEPLQVQIVALLASCWSSDAKHLQVGESLDELIQTILRLVSSLSGIGTLDRVLAYFVSVKDGLSYPEVLDILSCDDSVLDNLSSTVYKVSPLRRCPALVWFRAWSFLQTLMFSHIRGGIPMWQLQSRGIKSVIEKLLDENKWKHYISLELFDFFDGRWADGKKKLHPSVKDTIDSPWDRCVTSQPISFIANLYNKRKLQELPQQAFYVDADNMKQQYVYNFAWIMAKLHGTGVYSVIQDVVLVLSAKPEDEELKLLLEWLRLSSRALAVDPSQFYVQFNVRFSAIMNEKAEELPNLKIWFDKCMSNDVSFFVVSHPECLAQPKSKVDNFTKNQLIISSLHRLKNANNYMVSLMQERGEIRVWDVHKRLVVRTLRGLTCPRDAKFIDDTKAVVLCNRELKIYNLDTGEMEVKLKGIMNQKMPFYELHDSNHVVSLSRNRMYIHIIQINTGDTVSTFKAGEDRFLNSLMVSANGHYLVCGDETQKPAPLLVWDLNNRKLIYDLRINNHEFLTKMMAVSSDGHFVVCVCKEVISDDAINNVVIYDLTTGTMFKKWKPGYNATALSISTEADWVAAAVDNGSILIWDLTTGTCKHVLYGHQGNVDCLIASVDGARLLSYETSPIDSSIRLWDTASGNCLCALTFDEPIVCGQLTLDGRMVVLAMQGWESLLTLYCNQDVPQPAHEVYGSEDRSENVYTVDE